jgi:hypothetical protein
MEVNGEGSGMAKLADVDTGTAMDSSGDPGNLAQDCDQPITSALTRLESNVKARIYWVWLESLHSSQLGHRGGALAASYSVRLGLSVKDRIICAEGLG